MDVEDRKICYEIYRAKDARYDGRFFVGITTTGIYCRPVCRARLPKPENCRYFRTAAEAEKAGFRPCLLCRPELAPGTSRMDASSELARKAIGYLRDSCDCGSSLEDLAAELGCSERHLRRVFRKEFRVTPVEYLQTCRLLLAKQLLTETNLTILDVAMTAGFGSIRRMNELFQSHYGLTPGAMRRRAVHPGAGGAEAGRADPVNADAGDTGAGGVLPGRADPADAGAGDAAPGTKVSDGTAAIPGGTISVSLGYRSPYAWEEMLAFLKPRAIPHVERVADGAYERTLRLTARNGVLCRGALRVRQDPEKRSLRVDLSESLVPVMPQVLSKVRQMFDLDCDPLIIDEKLKGMQEFLPAGFLPGLRVPGCFDAFEMVCRAVIGQQITVKAASTLCGRLAEALGEPFETWIPGLDRTFPAAREIASLGKSAADRMGRLGIIASRSLAIQAIAVSMQEKDGVRLNRAADPETEIMRLEKIRGIGSWTAKYIAMRTMGWTDAFLETDAGIRAMLPGRSSCEKQKLSEAWQPWRSYAMMQFWNQQGRINTAARPTENSQEPGQRQTENGKER